MVNLARNFLERSIRR